MFVSSLAAALGSPATPSFAGAELQPLGHTCKAENGVRFCPTETLSQRAPSWDRVPLDADVTLPATGSGPWPTIVMMHGWSTSKTELESNVPNDEGLGFYDYNNVYFAQHGYAVLNYTARGWGNSCGSVEARETEVPAGSSCEEGFIHLADTRYESRDTQYLLARARSLLHSRRAPQPGAAISSASPRTPCSSSLRLT
jgi:fermentation-respiration switch protein FrsA (DUF1100 family)